MKPYRLKHSTRLFLRNPVSTPMCRFVSVCFPSRLQVYLKIISTSELQLTCRSGLARINLQHFNKICASKLSAEVQRNCSKLLPFRCNPYAAHMEQTTYSRQVFWLWKLGTTIQFFADCAARNIHHYQDGRSGCNWKCKALEMLNFEIRDLS